MGTAFQGPAGRATKVSQLPGKALDESCRYEDKMCTDSSVVLRCGPRRFSVYQWGFFTRTDTQDQTALQIQMPAQADHEPRGFLRATAPQRPPNINGLALPRKQREREILKYDCV